MTAGDAKGDKPEKPGETEMEKKAALTKKVIRIITVMAYVSGVSGAGVLLSLYYIIFWDPQIKGTRPRGYLRADPLTADAPLGEMMYENDPLQPMALTAARAHVPVVVANAQGTTERPRDERFSPDALNNHSADNGMVLEAPKVLPLNEIEDENSSPSLLSSSRFAPLPPPSGNHYEMAKIQVKDRVEEELNRMRDGGLDEQMYQDTMEQQQKKSMRSFQSEHVPRAA